jgi:23S rRNA pseudouridine1911/1915/1917 synthase
MKTISCNTIIPDYLIGTRLDAALAKLFPDYSRSQLKAWIAEGKVLLDNKVVDPDTKVKSQQSVIINATLENHGDWVGENIPLDIVYEDKALLIINKPVGLVVHPALGNYEHTLVNALLNYLPDLSKVPRAGIIHRLDKDTSGLLVVAKTLTAHNKLVHALAKREIKREYEAIVNGLLISGGTIEAPIARHSINRKKMAVVESGKPAVTHYRVIEKFTAHTHVRVMLETGRTHQIRVHFAHINHPVLGDKVYGKLQLPKNASESLINNIRNFKRQALHAKKLGLAHPTTGKWMEWEIPLPEDMHDLIISYKL